MTHPQLTTSMQQPEFYPHPAQEINLIETHISYVFLAGDFVYKVKKGVNLGFLDFSDLRKRHYYCREELRLNKRLAPGIYLEVIPIVLDEKETISLGADPGSQIIDYALKMVRLPEEGMLPRLLDEGTADSALFTALAGKLAHFHETAAAVPEKTGLDFMQTLQENMSENFSQTRNLVDLAVTRHRCSMIEAYSNWFFKTHQEILSRRAATGRVRECHGDLRLEHICLYENDLVVFDCIEFNERFRFIDVAADLAFLLMDLEYNGYWSQARTLLTGYLEKSHDQEIRILLNFFKCYYACTRAKVAGIRSAEAGPEKRAETLHEASDFFELAFTYALHLVRPTLILVCGLMGTGKSTLARNIGPYLGAEIIKSDAVRKELLGIPEAEEHHTTFGKGIYSPEISKLTYARLFTQAAKHLRAGRSVILDASFKRQRDRQEAQQTADDFGARFLVLECTCRRQTAEKRLMHREHQANEASDGRRELFQAQRDDFEPIREFSPEIHLRIDTDASERQCREQTLEDIIRRLRPE
ncbi:MAG: AAA family ATPase [Desulfohalobiaceae bacterium]|nr:AAA family ATPase [Desulfohalobiaceae bacterium]